MGNSREGEGVTRRRGETEIDRNKGGGKEDWKERVKELERRWERKERENRRKNLVVKGMKVGEEGMRNKVEEILRELEREVNVEEVRRVEAGRREKGSMLVVKVQSEWMKRNILMNKWKLKGREVWIEEDLTWEERRIKWKIGQVALKEKLKGKKIRVGQQGIWIEETWWRWDEGRDELTEDRKGGWGGRGEMAKKEGAKGEKRVQGEMEKVEGE